MRQQIDIAGGVIACVVSVAFAGYLMFQAVPMNVATWLLLTVLNAVNAVAMFRAGNKQFWLPVGFSLGAFLIAVMVFRNGTWSWGTVETFALGFTAAALVASYQVPKGGVLLGVTALWIAASPTLLDGWTDPQPESWWLWAGSLMGCMLSFLAAKGWSPKDRAYSGSGVIFNTTMWILVLLR